LENKLLKGEGNLKVGERPSANEGLIRKTHCSREEVGAPCTEYLKKKKNGKRPNKKKKWTVKKKSGGRKNPMDVGQGTGIEYGRMKKSNTDWKKCLFYDGDIRKKKKKK